MGNNLSSHGDRYTDLIVVVVVSILPSLSASVIVAHAGECWEYELVAQ
jgi:hypothetical protein